MRMFKLATLILCCLCLFTPVTLWADYSTESSRFVYPNYSKRISMDFKDAALEDVLKIFSQQSGMNFIAASELNNKKVTLFLDNIPVEEALEKILSANGLEYEMQPGSDIFVVKALPGEGQDLITKIYHLKYATVPSSKLNSTITISGSSESSGSETTVASTPASSSGDGILSAVRGVLSRYGKVMEDARTNSLIVTDVEAQFKYIESLIARLDVDVPQIMIEVEM
ncbi:MAG: secretin and TonB N-terminal domain-containing protein, partial [Candidatus Omnitrophica bacterium]|nr:secretin and TonB N-terminal domain-containing protein [Candidatus Omnitrophota bacterium]